MSFKRWPVRLYFTLKSYAFIAAQCYRCNIFSPNNKNHRRVECTALQNITTTKTCVLQAERESQPHVNCSTRLKSTAVVMPGDAVKSSSIISESTCDEFLSYSLLSRLFLFNRWCSRNHSNGIYCVYSIYQQQT